MVEFSPLYSPASVGIIERQHRDLKSSLKAALIRMGSTSGSRWMEALPWILLARRTSVHNDIQATPAELVLGNNPRLPGDLQTDMPLDKSIPDLLNRLKKNAERPPQPTSLHKELPTYFPPAAQRATHVFTKNHKRKPLDPVYSGPFPILERLGKSCLKIEVGKFKSGSPRTEVHHWRNCVPSCPPEGTKPATRATLGRPKQIRS